MNATYGKGAIAAALMCALLLPATGAGARGFGGGGGFSGGDRGGGGGFDMHGESAPSAGQSASHSSTGPAGTQRTTTATNTGSGYDRSTTATNGDASRTSTGSASTNGNYSHSSTGSDAYGSHTSSTSGNTNTGNYNHSGSGSNPYGSYNDSGSGNTYNHTYSGSGTATNAYGQTYHTSTYASNGTVYHGTTVSNPVYYGYPAWGWNAGVAWYPAPIYYGGAFWGAFAIGAATAVAYGSIVAANNVTVTSYQVEPESPGAKLLASYKLTQTQCGPPSLVVIYGPNGSVICAKPNTLVAAGNYSVDPSTLTIVSEKPGTSGAPGAAAAPPAAPPPVVAPLAAIAVGASANFHITSQSETPDGPASANYYVHVARETPGRFTVSIDGAPAVSVDVDPAAGITTPLTPALKTALSPFMQMHALMRGAPAPIAPASAWGSTLTVPVDGGQTDTIPIAVSVQQLNPGGATVVAAGQNSMDVQPGIRDFPTTVSATSTMYFNGNRLLTQGSGSVSVVLHKRLGRTDHFGTSWTVSLVGA